MNVFKWLLAAFALTAVAFSPAQASTHQTKHKRTPPGPGWKMAFHDDFTGKKLNTHQWAYCWPYMPSNTCTNDQEAEFYRPANVKVANGSLQLTAKKQKVVENGWPTRYYTSGMVTSAGHFDFRYGYAEARMKIPPGIGFWTAFWLQPTDHSWPPEIDVMEHLGQKPTVSGMAYHWTDKKGQHTYNHWLNSAPLDYERGWHSYGLDWEKGGISWYIDGKLKMKFTGTTTTKKMWLNFNFAVSSDPKWGVPGKTTHFPSTVQVDWVRVWRKS
jgi:beta-glucanase (GH16 family)